MPENRIMLWDEVNKSEFDFEKYYVNALKQKDKTLDYDEVYQRIEELKERMSNFITLDLFKMFAIADSDNILLGCTKLAVIIAAYQTPLLPDKTRAGMISDSLTSNIDIWERMDKNDVKNFINELVLLSLKYSTVFDENNTLEAQAAKTVGNFAWGYFKKATKKILPITPLEMKWLLTALYQAIGIYIINRDYLAESQEHSVEQAKMIYKKVMVYRKKNAINTLFGS